MASDCTLLWLDLEMTGLDVDSDSILEIAVIATDMQLSKIIEGPSLVIHQSEERLSCMNSWVREHHTASGLLTKVADSQISVARAEQRVIDFVHEYFGKKEFYFAGNSIYVDRSFLRSYMPKLDARGHYRLVDVSSIKTLVEGWYPDQPESDFKKKKTHRALDDIRESIDELKHYRKYFFKSF